MNTSSSFQLWWNIVCFAGSTASDFLTMSQYTRPDLGQENRCTETWWYAAEVEWPNRGWRRRKAVISIEYEVNECRSLKWWSTLPFRDSMELNMILYLSLVCALIVFRYYHSGCRFFSRNFNPFLTLFCERSNANFNQRQVEDRKETWKVRF
jgi:hypothetical protein